MAGNTMGRILRPLWLASCRFVMLPPSEEGSLAGKLGRLYTAASFVNDVTKKQQEVEKRKAASDGPRIRFR
jgi:hypothetical protein